MARWVIHSRTAFEAKHALASYRGEPEEPHSHRWEVAIRVGTEQLNEEGFALDFHQVHKTLEESVAPLDGSDLNRHPEIGLPSSTAERVTEVIAILLRPQIEALGGCLLTVSVWEGPMNRVDLNLEE
jgi:6-pyruvoyltetrahydropterin/6-carboxytetrahydropterin synthase